MDEQIARAIIEIALFLEFSSDDTIDPDASIAAMEQMAANLQLAGEAARGELADRFRALAGEYGDREQFVAELSESFGI